MVKKYKIPLPSHPGKVMEPRS